MKGTVIVFSAIFLFLFLLTSIPAYSQSPDTCRTGVRVGIDIFGVPDPGDTLIGYGRTRIKWIPLSPGHTETERDTNRLIVKSSELGLLRFLDGELPTMGEANEIDPGTDFPAESFFDVYFKLELPDLMPGDTLYNDIPMHIEGIIDDMPPYFDSYVLTNGPIPLLNSIGDIVGEITYWEEEFIPYSEPEAFIHIDNYYRSGIAEIDEMTGMIQVSMAMAGGLQPDHVSFYWRHAGMSEPFVEFYMDPDGNAPIYSTFYQLGDGDGWSGYLDPGIFNPDGEEIEFKGCAFTPEGTIYCDSTILTVDPTPPLPFLPSFPPDSLGLFFPDSMHPVTCLHQDEDPDTVEMWVFPLATEKHRDLTEIDMYELGTPQDSMACGPTSGASCLDYFARNGHPELKHPNGDTSKPEQSPKETAKELVGRMGTDADDGTPALNVALGIKQHLEAHGKSGWTVDGELINDYHDVGEMFREFEADKEDIIMKLNDRAVVDGDTVEVGHFVTLGSKSSTFYAKEYEWGHVSGMTYRLDFMDPKGGGSTEDNEYNVGEKDGKATLEGYSFGGIGPVSIRGYIKVSPPEGDGGGGNILRAPSSDGWIKVDSKLASGPGMTDSLYWNTSGFEPGTYLLEVRVTDAGGNSCRELRLCGIPFFTTDSGDRNTAPIPSGLIGSYPNPFNPNTTILYSVDRKGPVDISIYDVSGRLISKLLDGEVREAGNHKVRWNGLNSNGAPVASGAYFCRMSAAGKGSSLKVILLR